MNETDINNLPEFPHLHPLQAWDEIVKQYPEIASVIHEFETDYNFYLDNYLDAQKVFASLDYLRRKHPDIKSFILECDISDFQKDVKDIRTEKIPQSVWVIWVYLSAAFILINRAIDERNIKAYVQDIILCFKNAHEYKRIWKEREPRYRGAENANNTLEKRKQYALAIIKELYDARVPAEQMFEPYKAKFIAKYPGVRLPFNKRSFLRNDSDNPIHQAITQ